MKTKILLFLSTAISVLILLIIGGVLISINNGNTPENSSNQTTQSIAQPIQQITLQREAAYQAVIQEANTRLQKANEVQRQLEEQIRSQQSAVSNNPTQPRQALPAAPSEGIIPVTPQQAAQIAQNAIGVRENVQAIKIISVNEEPVYEVSFPQGSIYVNFKGQIVYPQPEQKPTPQLASDVNKYEEEKEEDNRD